MCGVRWYAVWCVRYRQRGVENEREREREREKREIGAVRCGIDEQMPACRGVVLTSRCQHVDVWC